MFCLPRGVFAGAECLPVRNTSHLYLWSYRLIGEQKLLTKVMEIIEKIGTVSHSYISDIFLSNFLISLCPYD